MNKIKTFGEIILLILFNFFIITTDNLAYLIIIATAAYAIGIFIDSTRVTLKRMCLFFLIGLSIMIFQVFFNQTVPLQERLLISLRSVLKLSSIGEIVLLGVKLISPLELISAFDFLPRSFLLLLSMTFYFIPLLQTEQNTIRLIQQSRGLGNSFRSRLLQPVAFMIPLLHRIFQRAETISFTILSRGFRE